MSLYQFTELRKFLTSQGYVIGQRNIAFELKRGIDFKKAYDEGQIDFRTEGIYLRHNERDYRGYMYMPEYEVQRWGNPKMHLTQCKTILDYIKTKKFNEYYVFSTGGKVEVIDRSTGERYQDQILPVCGNCKRMILEAYSTSIDFHASLDPIDTPESLEVDIFGYPKQWTKISRAYRKKVDYTCERCGISPRENRHQRYWDVDHIDGDKTNLSESNLQCLCKCCHSTKDNLHEVNFRKNRINKELQNFVNLYQDELSQRGSRCIDKFE